MEQLNTTPMTDEGKPLYLDESGERFIDIDGNSGAQGNPLYHTAESQSLDEYDRLQQAHNESEARNKAIDGMFGLDNLLTLKAEVERAQSIARDESYLGGTQKGQEQVFDHSRGIKDARVAHYVNVWVGKDAPADLRNALSAIVGAEIALSYQDLQDKAEAEAHSDAKSGQNEQKLPEYLGNLSPMARKKIEAALAPRKDDNEVGGADTSIPFIDDETHRQGSEDDQEDDTDDESDDDRGPDNDEGGDGGAETGDEPESAGKRKRSRWPLGIGAVAGFFGRSFRNIFSGEPSDSHTSAMGGRLRIEEGAADDVDEVQDAPADESASETQDAEPQSDDVIVRVPRHSVPEMSAEELDEEREKARDQSRSATAITKDGTRTPVPVLVRGDRKRFRAGITDNLGIRPSAANRQESTDDDSRTEPVTHAPIVGAPMTAPRRGALRNVGIATTREARDAQQDPIAQQSDLTLPSARRRNGSATRADSERIFATTYIVPQSRPAPQMDRAVEFGLPDEQDEGSQGGGLRMTADEARAQVTANAAGRSRRINNRNRGQSRR